MNIEMKEIPGYEGLYAITKDGRVWSYRRQRFLNPEVVHNGYLRVNLWANGKNKHMRVNRLVLMTYEPVEGMDKLEANHIDEDKTNNHVDNLCWMTKADNLRYGTRTQRAVETRWGKR